MAAKPTKSEGHFLQTIQQNNNTISKEEQLVCGSKCVKINTNSTNNNKISNSNDENNLLISVNSEKVVTKACDCTNISIMHLFHEMKQNFPTIPDTIVAEYVSDNCHQRENCMKLLRKEVEMKPVPTQTYPAKIVHPPNTTSVSHLSCISKATLQQKNPVKLTKMLKPIRPAPPQPLSVNRTIDVKQSDQNKKSPSSHITSSQSAEIMLPAIHCKGLAPQQTDKIKHNNTELGENCRNIPRARPTTLNLKKMPQQLQQQRQLLNVQVQQQLQQTQDRIIKPLRKAPLPPVQTSKLNTTPKQCHSTSNNASTNLVNHLSEAEISVNLTLSTTTPTLPTSQHYIPTSQLQSPKRHRSVITLQPEPPYTRDFLISTKTTTRPTHASPVQLNGDSKRLEEAEAGTPTSLGTKSFTSVNLTLRPPTLSNGQSPQQRPSTIDISAGPGLAGVAGTGFSYSSSSYDARQGYRKNFHITVTDDGGVISASRINERQEQEKVPHQQQQHYLLKQQKQQQNMDKKCFASCLEQSSHTESNNESIALVIKRQKGRCDKLRLALIENKKRLQRVNKEINVIKEPISNEVKEQLALDIQKLCEDCESIVDEIENMRRCKTPTITQHNRTHYPLQQMQSFPQQQENLASTTLQDQQYQQSLIFPDSCNLIQNGEQIATRLYQQRNLNNEESYDSDDFGAGGFRNSTGDNSNIVIEGNVESDDIVPEFWECKLCTFHNYPDLNMCECCNVVRILPGTLSNFNLPRVTNVDATTANFLDNNSHGQLNSHIEHDTNCLSQHFALHT